MPDKKEIRRRLWYSLDMRAVKESFCLGLIIVFIVAVLISPRIWQPTDLSLKTEGDLIFVLLISGGPIFAFNIWRTIRIFRCASSYHFCKTTLCKPKGGILRDTIYFSVLLEDADGHKFFADTHSVFYTHSGLTGRGLENYVNQTVTIGYNKETGQVVVIGKKQRI